MLKENLYEEVLLKPAVDIKADGLMIVAGYAFSSMALRHIKDLRVPVKNRDFKLELIVGMVPAKTLQRKDHEGFVILSEQVDSLNFKCSYVHIGEAVHSKMYIWTKNKKPIASYVGSANYSQKAFFERREVLYSCSPHEALEYFTEIQEDTIDCGTPDIENMIAIIDKQEKELHDDESKVLRSADNVNVPLLQADGEIGQKSGLNWGQRLGRDPDQAYIPINSSELRESDFFPDKGTYFNVRTDDGRSMIFVRAQDNGKALETPLSNSILGLYFRERIGLKSGDFVTKEDLEDYGRTDVDFYRIADYYYMDFSV